MTGETRPYRKKRRAELEERTRLRITESAVELHGSVGPARTSMSSIAERAGVRRSTLYRHFPDEEAVFEACSAHWEAANPAPDPRDWEKISDPDDRLETALRDLYRYFRRGEAMIANLLRDAETVPVVDRTLEGFRAYLDDAARTLMRGRRERGGRRRVTKAGIGHALSFRTWRSLVREQGLSDEEAADLMAAFVDLPGSRR